MIAAAYNNKVFRAFQPLAKWKNGKHTQAERNNARYCHKYIFALGEEESTRTLFNAYYAHSSWLHK